MYCTHDICVRQIITADVVGKKADEFLLKAKEAAAGPPWYMEPPMAVYYTQYLYVYKLFFNMCVGLGLNVFECLYAAQRQELRCRRSTVLEHFASETPSAGR